MLPTTQCNITKSIVTKLLTNSNSSRISNSIRKYELLLTSFSIEHAKAHIINSINVCDSLH